MKLKDYNIKATNRVTKQDIAITVTAKSRAAAISVAEAKYNYKLMNIKVT